MKVKNYQAYRVAKGDGSCRRSLFSDAMLSQGGTIRAYKPVKTSKRINTLEYSGGPGPSDNRGLLQASVNCLWVVTRG